MTFCQPYLTLSTCNNHHPSIRTHLLHPAVTVLNWLLPKLTDSSQQLHIQCLVPSSPSCQGPCLLPFQVKEDWMCVPSKDVS